MKKRILTLLLSLVLLVSAAAAGTGSAFAATDAAPEGALLSRSRSYNGQFADVASDAWYYPYIAASYEFGLLEGRGDGFAPEENVTVAELLTLSARLRALYQGDSVSTATGAEWYMPYVRYLDEQGLLERSLPDYRESATRAQLAAIFALSLPKECFDARNDALVSAAYASGGYITDVDESTPYSAQILWLYRQGLLIGMDEQGSFLPDRPTSRAEVAAVVTRMVEPVLRLTPDWDIPPAEDAPGKGLAALVPTPESCPTAPAFDDKDAIGAAVQYMLASNQNRLEFKYAYIITQSESQSLANAFAPVAKSYCEQMYNSVSCQPYLRSGRLTVTFSATACDAIAEQQVRDLYPNANSWIRSQKKKELSAALLAQYREETMAKALEIRSALWADGTLHEGMSQYEIARVYFLWLCEHCDYDYAAVSDNYSVSHIAYSALLLDKAVCDGYTGAYNLFLKLEGIKCYALPNKTHIWTVAELDGVEQHIDVTWGDQNSDPLTYFAMTPEQSYAEHPW